ncbi:MULTISPECIES: hypothetical protein [unclassified Beijerinckia]|uniref:hypothetical protein n=1 Tax=unclassified Beijerinckia TaxID=2638183 RepID=UPI000897D2ED|nr:MULTISPECIES: hypothetical protein [unclassified Beijerinckia]MDH7798151.1 hypothetical protein [Beijerinckia sp. GAS462]SED10843.1 hypothetical protein SAMN05443249_4444 [Beijerinckia sp. 28-YEA-48]
MDAHNFLISDRARAYFEDCTKLDLFRDLSTKISDLIPLIAWTLGVESRNRDGEIIAQRGPHYAMTFMSKDKILTGKQPFVLLPFDGGTIGLWPGPDVTTEAAYEIDVIEGQISVLPRA